jgi:hypothetical protein
MANKPLTAAQREALEDLLVAVEMHEAKLRAASAQAAPAGHSLAAALRQILEALTRCKDADL